MSILMQYHNNVPVFYVKTFEIIYSKINIFIFIMMLSKCKLFQDN